MNTECPTDRETALELLRSQHAFPGPYVFRIVVHPPVAAAVVSAVSAALSPDGSVEKVVEHPSRTGKYVALHMHSIPPSAEVVLDVYAVIATLDGVLLTL